MRLVSELEDRNPAVKGSDRKLIHADSRVVLIPFDASKPLPRDSDMLSPMQSAVGLNSRRLYTIMCGGLSPDGLVVAEPSRDLAPRRLYVTLHQLDWVLQVSLVDCFSGGRLGPSSRSGPSSLGLGQESSRECQCQWVPPAASSPLPDGQRAVEHLYVRCWLRFWTAAVQELFCLPPPIVFQVVLAHCAAAPMKLMNRLGMAFVVDVDADLKRCTVFSAALGPDWQLHECDDGGLVLRQFNPASAG